jgi:hypothetical protein
LGEIRKKKDKKKVTCYYYWEKRYYVYKCLKKMTTQSFIVEIPLESENVEEKYLELIENTLVTKKVSDKNKSN